MGARARSGRGRASTSWWPRWSSVGPGGLGRRAAHGDGGCDDHSVNVTIEGVDVSRLRHGRSAIESLVGSVDVRTTRCCFELAGDVTPPDGQLGRWDPSTLHSSSSSRSRSWQRSRAVRGAGAGRGSGAVGHGRRDARGPFVRPRPGRAVPRLRDAVHHRRDARDGARQAPTHVSRTARELARRVEAAADSATAELGRRRRSPTSPARPSWTRSRWWRGCARARRWRRRWWTPLRSTRRGSTRRWRRRSRGSSSSRCSSGSIAARARFSRCGSAGAVAGRDRRAMGISQMHVSRLLRSALAQLDTELRAGSVRGCRVP